MATVERAKVDFLGKCQTVRQLSLDCSFYERKYQALTSSSSQTTQSRQAREEQESVYVEVVNRKEQYKASVGSFFESPCDLSGERKRESRLLFEALDGVAWSRTFGWAGQSLNVTRPEVGAMEAPLALYDGISFSVTVSGSLGTGPVTAAAAAAALSGKQTSKAANTVTGTLTGINLSGFGCRGQFPSFLSFLNSCETISFQLNRISGPLPSSAMRQWQQVKHLKLAGNQIGCSGDALAALQHLVQLEVLDLSFNSLSGGIPDVFTSLTKLEIINLAGNLLDGPIPNSITTLTCLKELKLQSNRLDGIPAGFTQGHCKSLRHINLSNNCISEGGVHSFNGMVSLEVLMMNNNMLSGRLDGSTLFSLKNLTILYLHCNKLSGTIPDELCTLKKLRYCDLSSNQFRGRLPNNIGDLKSLEKLLAHNNNIIGPVPRSIGQLLSHLRDFYVFRPFHTAHQKHTSISIPPRKFRAFDFERVFVFGPNVGIDSMHWDHELLYGQARDVGEDETVTIFSGKL